MSDYLIWAAERLESKYNWDFDDAMEYLTSNKYTPYDVSIEKYIQEEQNANNK